MVTRKRAPARSGGSTRHEHGKTFKYRNHTIELLDEPGHVHVKIDGEHLHAARIGPGSYHSHILMYQDFPTLENLAMALVDTEGTLWLPAGHPVGHPLAPAPKGRAATTKKKPARKKSAKSARKPKPK
jgi:hypothetical protein